MKRGKTISKILTAALILAALFFFSRTEMAALTENALFKILRPFMKISAGFRELTGINYADENETAPLKEDAILKSLSFTVASLKNENAVLKKALGFREESSLTDLRGARVIFYAKEFGKEHLIADLGEKDGVKNGDLAIDAEKFIVGFVGETGENFSKIDIVSNAGRTFEGEILSASTTEPILIKSLGARGFSLELIPPETNLDKNGFVALLLPERKYLFPAAKITAEEKKESFKRGRAVLLTRPEILKEIFILPLRQ